jgi:hypothetical protein
VSHLPRGLTPDLSRYSGPLLGPKKGGSDLYPEKESPSVYGSDPDRWNRRILGLDCSPGLPSWIAAGLDDP